MVYNREYEKERVQIMMPIAFMGSHECCSKDWIRTVLTFTALGGMQ